MSQLANHEIEAIVRMVVDRLRDSGVVASSTGSSSSTGNSFNREPIGPRSSSVTAQVQASITESIEPGVLVIPTPLITLDDIQGKLHGIHTLNIAARSLLTPAVKDELRRAKVKITRGEVVPTPATTKAGSVVSGSYFIVASHEKLNVIKSVAKQIAISALPTSLTMQDTVDQLTKLDASQQAIWCTSRPYAALMACSQASTSMRVACLHQAADLHQAVLEIQPNLLVLDDARWSSYQVGRLVQAWARFGERGGSK